jgi:hypothetical protein
MFRWLRKVQSDGFVEDECQELSPRAMPPVTAKDAFHKWITTPSVQPTKSKKPDNV